jgi:hypothetical protein
MLRRPSHWHLALLALLLLLQHVRLLTILHLLLSQLKVLQMCRLVMSSCAAVPSYAVEPPCTVVPPYDGVSLHVVPSPAMRSCVSHRLLQRRPRRWHFTRVAHTTPRLRAKPFVGVRHYVKEEIKNLQARGRQPPSRCRINWRCGTTGGQSYLGIVHSVLHIWPLQCPPLVLFGMPPRAQCYFQYKHLACFGEYYGRFCTDHPHIFVRLHDLFDPG